MEQVTFTSADIDVLLDALRIWEEKSGVDMLFGHMIGGLLPRDNTKAKAEYEQLLAEKEAEEKKLKQQRREVATVLASKFIMLKQGMAVSQLVNVKS